MDNKQSLESVALGVVTCAVYDGIKKAISVGVPFVILSLSPAQKIIETVPKTTSLKAIYASEDRTFIGSPSPRTMMPFKNTFLTTTASTLSVVSGDQTMVRGI